MIETARLRLRPWRDADREPWAALNADPDVMAEFERPLSRAESDAALDGLAAHLQAHGFGEWAVERREDGAWLGMCGLARLGSSLPLGPGVELGYRFARRAWGCGYASEAARAALAFGFERAGLEEVVAFTATTNTRSQAVMARSGMVRTSDRDFEHPALPVGHRLRPHVVWAIARERWRVAAATPFGV